MVWCGGDVGRWRLRWWPDGLSPADDRWQARAAGGTIGIGEEQGRVFSSRPVWPAVPDAMRCGFADP